MSTNCRLGLKRFNKTQLRTKNDIKSIILITFLCILVPEAPLILIAITECVNGAIGVDLINWGLPGGVPLHVLAVVLAVFPDVGVGCNTFHPLTVRVDSVCEPLALMLVHGIRTVPLTIVALHIHLIPPAFFEAIGFEQLLTLLFSFGHIWAVINMILLLGVADTHVTVPNAWLALG